MDVRQIFSFLLLFSGLAIADPTDASDVVVPDSPPIGKIASVTPLFEHGYGYNIYRIPATTCAPNGDLIVVCDGRVAYNDLNGSRKIDIVMRRSSDGGNTWTPCETAFSEGEGKPVSDPSLVTDRITGELFCFYNFMDQDLSEQEYRLHVRKSQDNGKSWDNAIDITGAITPETWNRDFKFITSGQAWQTRDGKILHTLVNLNDNRKGVFLFGSHDHGKSWKRYEALITPADESKFVELSNGEWMVNSRVNGNGCRYVHRSRDGGKTWESTPDAVLVDPSCNAVILPYRYQNETKDLDLLFFCNNNDPVDRKNLTLRLSTDQGKTWTRQQVLDPGDCGYVDMTALPDGTLGIVYETANGCNFLRFIPEWADQKNN